MGLRLEKGENVGEGRFQRFLEFSILLSQIKNIVQIKKKDLSSCAQKFEISIHSPYARSRESGDCADKNNK